MILEKCKIDTVREVLNSASKAQGQTSGGLWLSSLIAIRPTRGRTCGTMYCLSLFVRVFFCFLGDLAIGREFTLLKKLYVVVACAYFSMLSSGPKKFSNEIYLKSSFKYLNIFLTPLVGYRPSLHSEGRLS